MWQEKNKLFIICIWACSAVNWTQRLVHQWELQSKLLCSFKWTGLILLHLQTWHHPYCSPSQACAFLKINLGVPWCGSRLLHVKIEEQYYDHFETTFLFILASKTSKLFCHFWRKFHHFTLKDLYFSGKYIFLIL